MLANFDCSHVVNGSQLLASWTAGCACGLGWSLGMHADSVGLR